MFFRRHVPAWARREPPPITVSSHKLLVEINEMERIAGEWGMVENEIYSSPRFSDQTLR